MDVKTSRHRASIVVDKYELQETRERSCSMDQGQGRFSSSEVGVTQTDAEEALKPQKHQFHHTQAS